MFDVIGRSEDSVYSRELDPWRASVGAGFWDDLSVNQ